MFTVFALMAAITACIGISQMPPKHCHHKHVHYSFHSHMQQNDHLRTEGPVREDKPTHIDQ